MGCRGEAYPGSRAGLARVVTEATRKPALVGEGSFGTSAGGVIEFPADYVP